MLKIIIAGMIGAMIVTSPPLRGKVSLKGSVSYLSYLAYRHTTPSIKIIENCLKTKDEVLDDLEKQFTDQFRKENIGPPRTHDPNSSQSPRIPYRSQL